MQVEVQQQLLEILVEAVAGGAGAGIGGNGGNGGQANISIKGDSVNGDGSNFNGFESSGSDGEAGEDCGVVNIYNTLTVYAYGGSGAGSNYMQNTDSGCGGGGYPGAGIGGGGAGRGAVETMLLAVVDILVELDKQNQVEPKMVKQLLDQVVVSHAMELVEHILKEEQQVLQHIKKITQNMPFLVDKEVKQQSIIAKVEMVESLERVAQ